MSSGNDSAARLAATFYTEVTRIDGPQSLFLKALDQEGSRQTLDELSEYDALKDGFLLLPALQNMFVFDTLSLSILLLISI